MLFAGALGHIGICGRSGLFGGLYAIARPSFEGLCVISERSAKRRGEESARAHAAGMGLGGYKKGGALCGAGALSAGAWAGFEGVCE